MESGEANTPEKWDKILDKMIWSFEQIANDYEIYVSVNFKNSDWMDKYNDLNNKIFTLNISESKRDDILFDIVIERYPEALKTKQYK